MLEAIEYNIDFDSFLTFQCMAALQNSPLPEAAEIQDILQQIEFDGLFYTHDRLAERQV